MTVTAHRPDTAERPKISESELRRVANRLVDLGFAINPDGHPGYLVERINALLAEGVEPLPPESEWKPLPACPPFCAGVHPDDGQFRDCASEEIYVPIVDYDGRPGVVAVDVATTFDRATGRSTSVDVRVEDYRFTPQAARRLAVELMRAADLAEKKDDGGFAERFLAQRKG